MNGNTTWNERGPDGSGSRGAVPDNVDRGERPIGREDGSDAVVLDRFVGHDGAEWFELRRSQPPNSATETDRRLALRMPLTFCDDHHLGPRLHAGGRSIAGSSPASQVPTWWRDETR